MFQCSASRLTSRYSSAVDAAGRTDSTPLRHSRIPGSVADSRVVFPDDGLRRRGLAVVDAARAYGARVAPTVGDRATPVCLRVQNSKD